jgi:hypothetical protein
MVLHNGKYWKCTRSYASMAVKYLEYFFVPSYLCIVLGTKALTEFHLLGHTAVRPSESQSKFWENMSPPPSGLKSKHSMKQT